MSCNCMNFDGTPTPICRGTCKDTSEFIERVPVERSLSLIERNIEELIESFNHRLSCMSDIFNSRLSESYTRGFREGFEIAKDMYD